MGKTKIPYAERNWNVTVGCTHSGLVGCDNCWAKDLHDMRHKAWLEGKKVPQQYSRPFGEIILRPDRLDEALHIRKPTRFFICSMSDLFHPDVPFEYISKVLTTVAKSPLHIYLILTKRIQRAAEYFEEYEGVYVGKPEAKPVYFPLSNLWLIVSCSTQKELDENVPILLQIPVSVRGVSLEPLIEEIKFKGLYEGYPERIWISFLNRLNWVIVGAESGRNRRPCNIEWIRKIVADCQAAGVAAYVKQLDIDGRLITNPDQFPEDLRIRDLPK